MHLSVQPDIGSTWEEINIVTQTKHKGEVRCGPPLVLRVNVKKFMEKVQVHAVGEGRGGWSGKETRLERQCPLGNLLPEIGFRLQKQKLYGSAGAERRRVERCLTKKALGTENAGAGREERGLRADPHRLQIPAELERVFAPDVSKIFCGLKML